MQALADSPDAFRETIDGAEHRAESQWVTSAATATQADRRLLLAERDARPVGMAVILVSASDPREANLYAMWVEPAARRLGLGRALLNAAIAWAETKGLSRVILRVTEGNDAARQLYREVGFVETGTRESLRPGSHLQVQVMRLHLRARGDRMVTWKEFAAAEPTLAETGRSLLTQFGVGLAFLATVRKDGAPRLHPVCPVLSNEGLYILITPTSPKRYDLLRDGRFALQTFPQPKPGSDEFYIAGKALLVEDPATRATVFRDAKHMAAASEVLFELWMDRVTHTRWEDVLTPQMRSVHRKWRAGGS
jgi:ribosomal protein S18 acetylase RimI-like enzyme